MYVYAQEEKEQRNRLGGNYPIGLTFELGLAPFVVVIVCVWTRL